MSPTATVKRFYAAWAADDLDAMLDVVDDDVKIEPALSFLYENAAYRGHDGLKNLVAEARERWQAFTPRVRHVQQDGDELTVEVQFDAHRAGEVLTGRSTVCIGLHDGRIASIRRAPLELDESGTVPR